MSEEKWYWKGNGVFKKDELIKKMKEDIIPDDNQTSKKGYKYLLEEDPFAVNTFLVLLTYESGHRILFTKISYMSNITISKMITKFTIVCI